LDGTAGICYTRTGRHFFDDMQLEAELIDRVRKVLDKSGFWGILILIGYASTAN